MRRFSSKIVQVGEKKAIKRSHDDSWQAICQENQELFGFGKETIVAEGERYGSRSKQSERLQLEEVTVLR